MITRKTREMPDNTYTANSYAESSKVNENER